MENYYPTLGNNMVDLQNSRTTQGTGISPDVQTTAPQSRKRKSMALGEMVHSTAEEQRACDTRRLADIPEVKKHIIHLRDDHGLSYDDILTRCTFEITNTALRRHVFNLKEKLRPSAGPATACDGVSQRKKQKISASSSPDGPSARPKKRSKRTNASSGSSQTQSQSQATASDSRSPTIRDDDSENEGFVDSRLDCDDMREYLQARKAVRMRSKSQPGSSPAVEEDQATVSDGMSPTTEFDETETGQISPDLLQTVDEHHAAITSQGIPATDLVYSRFATQAHEYQQWLQQLSTKWTTRENEIIEMARSDTPASRYFYEMYRHYEENAQPRRNPEAEVPMWFLHLMGIYREWLAEICPGSEVEYDVLLKKQRHLQDWLDGLAEAERDPELAELYERRYREYAASPEDQKDEEARATIELYRGSRILVWQNEVAEAVGSSESAHVDAPASPLQVSPNDQAPGQPDVASQGTSAVAREGRRPQDANERHAAQILISLRNNILDDEEMIGPE